MGSINYGSNNIINLGYNGVDDFAELSYNYIANILPNLEYYKIDIEYGYCEGFYLNIERQYFYLDNCYQKKEMLKEVRKIQTFLIDAVRYTECDVYTSCGWCGCSWLDKKEGIKEIRQAMKKERQVIKNYKLNSQFKTFDEIIAYTNKCDL